MNRGVVGGGKEDLDAPAAAAGDTDWYLSFVFQVLVSPSHRWNSAGFLLERDSGKCGSQASSR